jgi:hypothetical protein
MLTISKTYFAGQARTHHEEFTAKEQNNWSQPASWRANARPVGRAVRPCRGGLCRKARLRTSSLQTCNTLTLAAF